LFSEEIVFIPLPFVPLPLFPIALQGGEFTPSNGAAGAASVENKFLLGVALVAALPRCVVALKVFRMAAAQAGFGNFRQRLVV
jgi:hypothetical protein